MHTTLYIIGNGFDLHHGIRSAYTDFGKFLKINDAEVYSLIEKYFVVDDDFWSEFEARLADFDAHSLIEHASDFLVTYGTEEWRDSFHHDYQFEIEQVVECLSKNLMKSFSKWVKQLYIPDPLLVPSKLQLDSNAVFITFNYTQSLTNIYGIDRSRVLHIHGSVADPDADLILGHGWDPKERGSSNEGLDLESTDTRVEDGNRLIDLYFTRTFKPTAQVIEIHKPFFCNLRSIKKIIVMGHSFGDVDLPYFKKIRQCAQAKKVHWQISYYQTGEPEKFRRQLKHIDCVAGDAIEFAKLANM